MEGANKLQNLPDGTSNIILFAERYGTCGTGGDINGASTSEGCSPSPAAPFSSQ